MAEHLFLTGGTGFIGSRILQLWLERTEARITLLIRPRSEKRALGKIDSMLDSVSDGSGGPPTRRVRCVSGDLALPELGLNPDDRASISETTTHIIHAGAELRFDTSLARARRTNTAGTAAVLDMARICHRLASCSFVGTAYVAGRNNGTVWEDARPNGVRHNNSYERSKFEAELLVREAMADIPAVVLRPSIVTCDLETGYTPATSAFYRLLRGVAAGSLEVLPGRENNLLDMVPLDYIAETIFSIGRRPDLAGRCFHLSAGPENRVSLGELRDLACTSFGRDRLEILSPGEFRSWMAKAIKAAPQKKEFFKELELYIPYLTQQPLFDNSNTRAALEGSQMQNFPVSHYFDRVAAYVSDSFGPAS